MCIWFFNSFFSLVSALTLTWLFSCLCSHLTSLPLFLICSHSHHCRWSNHASTAASQVHHTCRHERRCFIIPSNRAVQLRSNCLSPSFVFSIRSEQWTNLSPPLPSIATATDCWSLHQFDCFPLFLVVWSVGFGLNGVDLAFVWVEWDFGYLGWFGFLLGWMGFRVCGSIWPSELMMFGWMGWWWWRLVAWWWRLVCEREIGSEWEGCEENNKK